MVLTRLDILTLYRVQPDPVPPRHTFDDDSSSDDESDVDRSNRQVSGYQDIDDQEPPKPKEPLMELDDIKVSLDEEIQNNATVVIGVELLYNVDRWFGESREVGVISTEKVRSGIIAPSNDFRIMENSLFQYDIIQTPNYTQW